MELVYFFFAYAKDGALKCIALKALIDGHAYSPITEALCHLESKFKDHTENVWIGG